MNVTFDTNIVVRLLMADDPVQLEQARTILADATRIALPIVALCEAVWVMRGSYRVPSTDLATIIQEFAADPRVRCDRALVTAGIDLLRRGGDFADAVIAADGRRLGGDTFITFDRRAARLLEAHGAPVTLPD